ncbi:hypothetical protein NUW54_g9088 [Trametes sanguinea]|uniref:Uncharacterized protein n=1 Tax=Trametes sanguinea TaxID=158606 RepID=A0ACC1P943_9APHY|nr:hypothetical protein NUW54_g9088 [Trametes sanguinea]
MDPSSLMSASPSMPPARSPVNVQLPSPPSSGRFRPAATLSNMPALSLPGPAQPLALSLDAAQKRPGVLPPRQRRQSVSASPSMSPTWTPEDETAASLLLEMSSKPSSSARARGAGIQRSRRDETNPLMNTTRLKYKARAAPSLPLDERQQPESAEQRVLELREVVLRTRRRRVNVSLSRARSRGAPRAESCFWTRGLAATALRAKDRRGQCTRSPRAAIQSSVTTAFRETTGVLTSDQPWPRWSEDGVFPGMAVNFEATVEHCVNRALFRCVAEVAMQDLKKHAPVHADWMSASDVKLTLGLLFEVAKRSFRGFKRVYKAQFDEEQRNQLNANARAARWLNRRRKKCSNLLKVTAMYMEKHGVDPTPLIVQEMMSDEASGPEDEATESQAEWKRRMADCAGVTKKTDEQLAKMVFFEAVHPNWRSEALTQILHELWSLFWQAVSTRTARAMTPRITDTDRQSDEPPQTAPYNFGINQDWYERFKDSNTHKVALKDWMNYPDPEGFGENAEVPDDPQENENGVA